MALQVRATYADAAACRYISPFVITAHAMRAVLLASATATFSRGHLASGRNLTVESDVTFRLACANASLRHARGHRN
jgi:hypothetical protein